MTAAADEDRKVRRGVILGMAVLTVSYLFVAYGILTGSVSLLNDHPVSVALQLAIPPLVLFAGAIGWWREENPREKASEGFMAMVRACLLAFPVAFAWLVVSAVLAL